MLTETIAGIDTIIVPGSATPRKHVVLLHGYGANNADLAPIASALSPHLPSVRWLMPNGFEPLGDLPFAFEGRQWFPLDRTDLDHYFQTKNYKAIGRLFINSLADAYERMLQYLKAADIPLQDLVLAGFSQGAMLATHVALKLPMPPSGLIALAGVMLPENGWEEAAQKRQTMPVFQAHGTLDMVLPFELAEHLAHLWRDNKVPHEFVSFPGGHEIPQLVLQGMYQFLRQQTTL